MTGRFRLPPRVAIGGAVWLAVLGAWIPVLDALWNHHAARTTIVTYAIVLGVAAVLSTLVIGAWLGFRRDWMLLVVAAGSGMATLVFWYTAITLAAPDPNGQNDHAAGVGSIILAIPALVIVAVPLFLAAGAGHAVKWLTSRHVPVPAPPPSSS